MKAITIKMIFVVIVFVLIFIELALASNVVLVKSEYCTVAREDYLCRTVLIDGVPYLLIMRETSSGMFLKNIYLITGESTILIFSAWEV